MIKRIFGRVKELLSSLRIKFVLIFLISVGIGVGIYFLAHYFAYDYIDTVYSNEDNRKEREDLYIRDLQSFVTVNGISSENTAKLSEWARENKYVYLIIYKDNELFYTSDDVPEEPPIEEPPDETPPEEELPEEELPEEELPEDESPEGDAENEGAGTETEPNGSQDADKKEEGKNPGGVTVDYPTREELFEYARKNDLHPLELADGTLFASLTEFTEYLYYDVSNIVSIIIALLFVLIILATYFHTVTSKIIRLGNEVNKVADGDITHVISARGRDEIAKLSVNVDNMRESMIENFKKEKEALDANSALITSMSHDIRTPLTVLLGYIDVMQTKAAGNSEMQQYLSAAESTAMRLKKLSDDMFGYFLVFGGRELEIKMEEYDAATLIDQMLFEHVTLMRESGYTVEMDATDYDTLEKKTIRTDAQKLVRIFDNVFSNVYKYADASRPVKITLEEKESSLVIRFSNVIAKNLEKVESNGIGLKTCVKLAEYINASFEYGSDGEEFNAFLTLGLK